MSFATKRRGPGFTKQPQTKCTYERGPLFTINGLTFKKLTPATQMPQEVKNLSHFYICRYFYYCKMACALLDINKGQGYVGINTTIVMVKCSVINHYRAWCQMTHDASFQWMKNQWTTLVKMDRFGHF